MKGLTMIKVFKQLTLFEIILIVSISLINIVSLFIFNDVNIIGFISLITGVLCVVMTAKGHISCYYWGIINILTYIYIAYLSSFYGEVMLNGLYYLPMQFVGIYLWKKNIKDDTGIIKAKEMTIKQLFMLVILSIVLILGYSYILELLQGSLPLADSTSTVLSVIAMYLTVKLYKEQWLLWIIVNIVSIYMWSIALINGEQNSILMIVMWTAYLINAFYGYYNWRKLAR
jgi:nicotinamide mononucleotide transporter